MPEEYLVFYPSATEEKEVIASVVIGDETSEADKIWIRRAVRQAAALSLRAKGITNVAPEARTVHVDEPRKVVESKLDLVN